MAKGAAHRNLTNKVALPASVAIVASMQALQMYAGVGGADFLLAVVAALGALAANWVHPDRDLNKSAGLFWYPYAIAYSHREVLTHGPLVGTLGRLLYLATLFLGGYYSLMIYYGWGAIKGSVDIRYPLTVCGALALADCLHLVGDRFKVGRPSRTGVVFYLLCLVFVVWFWPIVFDLTFTLPTPLQEALYNAS